MNLVIDIGNTRTKVFVFNEYRLSAQFTFQKLSALALRKIVQKYGVKNSILSSVVKENAVLVAFLRKNTRLIILDHKTPVPIRNGYKTRKTLGNDRLANACGTAHLFPSRNSLVIDAGTCVKYDFISSRKEYTGGAISPGMMMRYQALHDYTSKLPLIKPAHEVKILGSTTEESIISGVQQGILNEMNGYVQLFSKKFRNLKVILTGGDAGCFAHLFNFPIFAAPELTATGLNEILLHNTRKK